MGASGQCLCGAVSFFMEFPSKWVAHCHCTMCQRSNGAAFVTWVSIDDSQVRIDDSGTVLKWHSYTPEAQRGFCAQCGSSMFFRSEKWPGEIHITLANFIGPVDREPQIHAYYDTHVLWFSVNDELPKKPEQK